MSRLQLPIRTTRLTLRDFLPSDFAAVHAYASDPVVTRYMFFGPRTEAETANISTGCCARSARPRG